MQVSYPRQLVRRHGPEKVGVVERGDAAGFENRVNVFLNRIDDTVAEHRRNRVTNVQTVNVQRLLFESGSDLFSRNQQEALLGGEDRIQPVGVGSIIVIGEK